MTSVQEDTASHCHDCHDAVASVSCHPKRACGQVVASKFSEVSTPVAMKFWFVLQAQSEPGEQHPVTEDWKEKVLWTDRFDRFQGKCVLLVCCLGFGYFRYFYRLWTAFWFELIWKASPPDSPGARSPTTVREASLRKTVLRRLDVIEKFWSFSHASSILSTSFCVLFRGSGDVSLLRFWSVFAGTKRTWRAKSGHRGLGKNNLTVPKHARHIFCLDFKVASDHMHMHSEGLTSG